MGRFIDFSEQVTGGGTASFPDQTNNSGKVLVTNGAEVFWETRYTNSEVDTIIEQNGFGAISLESKPKTNLSTYSGL